MWCGVARCAVWCGAVWCDAVRCGIVWCGVVWCMMWYDVVWCGVAGGVVVLWCCVLWCGVVHRPFRVYYIRYLTPPYFMVPPSCSVFVEASASYEASQVRCGEVLSIHAPIVCASCSTRSGRYLINASLLRHPSLL